MNIIQLAANVQLGFDNFVSTAIMHPFENDTTWVSDLVIAMAYDNPEKPSAITETINGAIKNWKSNYHYFSALIFSVNWLAWYCYESSEYKQFSPIFSNFYYQLLDVADKSLTKDEVAQLYRLLD